MVTIPSISIDINVKETSGDETVTKSPVTDNICMSPLTMSCSKLDSSQQLHIDGGGRGMSPPSVSSISAISIITVGGLAAALSETSLGANMLSETSANISEKTFETKSTMNFIQQQFEKSLENPCSFTASDKSESVVSFTESTLADDGG